MDGAADGPLFELERIDVDETEPGLKSLHFCFGAEVIRAGQLQSLGSVYIFPGQCFLPLVFQLEILQLTVEVEIVLLDLNIVRVLQGYDYLTFLHFHALQQVGVFYKPSQRGRDGNQILWWYVQHTVGLYRSIDAALLYLTQANAGILKLFFVQNN